MAGRERTEGYRMIALIEVTVEGDTTHIMVDLHHDDFEQAKADVRALIRKYYKEEPEMSLAEFISEEFPEVDYFPLYVDVDDSVRVDGEVMSL